MTKPSKMEVVATDSDDEAFEDAGVVTTDAANSDTESDEEETEVLCSGTVPNYSNELDEEMPQAGQHPFSFSSSSGSSSSSSSSVRSLKSSDLQSIPNAPGCYRNNSRLNLNVGQVIHIDDKAYIVGISGLMPKLDNRYSVNSSSSSSSSDPTNEATPRKKRRSRPDSPQQNSSSSSSSSSAQQQHHIFCEPDTKTLAFYTDNSDPPKEIIQQYRVGDTILLNGTVFLIGANKRLWVSPKNIRPPEIPPGYSPYNRLDKKCKISKCNKLNSQLLHGINHHIATKHATALHECHICGYSSRRKIDYSRHIKSSNHLENVNNFKRILNDFINTALSEPAHHNNLLIPEEILLLSLENHKNIYFNFSKMSREFLKQEIIKILYSETILEASQTNSPNIHRPAKRQRTTQSSVSSSSIIQAQYDNIPSYDPESAVPAQILRDIEHGVTKSNGQKVTVESGDIIKIIFKDNDGKYIVNKYKVEKNESSISLSLGKSLKKAAKISYCLYCNVSTTHRSSLLYKHGKTYRHRENAGLPPLSEDKVYKCTSCNNYTAVTSSNLSQHQKTCQRKHDSVIESITAAVNNLPSTEIEKCSNNPQHIDTLVKKIVRESLKSLKRVPDSLLDFAEQAVKNHLLSRINPGASSHPPVSSARQLPLPDEMPISHGTSSSSSSPSIKQEPTIKEEENRSEDDMSDEDNGYSFFSNQSTPQPQSTGSPWVPFAEQRQVTNVDFPQEIINIPSYLFDEGQVVIGRTVIHDGQEYIILSFSSMQRKRS